jgi:two-component sensor histidine kinase
LNIQAEYITDPRSSVMFEETCNRLYSIAEIHELLYSSPEMARVDLRQYIRRLATKLFTFYGIHPELDIETAGVRLPIAQAVPCGLIVNELLVNTLKYAFPAERPGKISVTFQDGDHVMYVLRVTDDGVGLPEGMNWRDAKSMGLRLIRVLAHQLHGTLDLEPVETGVSFVLRFPVVAS